VAAIVVLFLLVSLASELNRRLQIQREVQRLEEDVDELNKDVVELANLNKYFRSADFQERLAREKLNYNAPGEEVILIPEEAQPPEEQEQLTVADRQPTIPEKWWQVFFIKLPK